MSRHEESLESLPNGAPLASQGNAKLKKVIVQ
jgi:hypothetical protein